MWYFDPKETAMDVYDHTGSLIVEDRAFGTNDAGDNGAWTGDYPDEVLAVMDEAFVAEVQANGLTTYAGQCLRHGAFELVEQGTP